MPGHLTVLELTDPQWVTLPFTDYCPPLAPAPQEEADLVGALRQASEAAGIRRVAVRAPLKGATSVSSRSLRHVIALDSDPAAAKVSLFWNGTTISKFSASDERYGA
jgi:hypothetical protein